MLADIQRIVNDTSYVPTEPRELCSRVLYTCYMGTENSSTKTKQMAADLAQELGASASSMLIDTAVTAVLRIFTTVIGCNKLRYTAQGGEVRENLALQNVQARLRMVLAYLFAQLTLWASGKQG